jgi:hypothetical protein
MSQEIRRDELQEQTQELLQGPLKHVRAAALAAALLPLASVAATPAAAESCPSAGVCGFVWFDADSDGIQDADESGISGALVTLAGQSQLTNADGVFYFPVPPGTYEIKVEVPDGMEPSPPDSGGDDTLDSDGTDDGAGNSVATVTLAEDEGEDSTTDFGFSPAGPAGAALLVIDEDSIDNGNPPNYFPATAVNDDLARIGLRKQLRFFEQQVGGRITLHTGQVGDEGWFALKTVPASWTSAGPTSDGLRNYLLAGPGLGSRNAFGDRESRLDKVPDVTPLRATGLRMLVGRDVCAVVYDSDVSINYDPLDGSLKGSNLGIVAFRVLSVMQLFGYSSSTLPQVEIEILDAVQLCMGPLTPFVDAPAPISSSLPFDIEP